MDSFPSLLPNSQLPSGILLTFFWFGPNLWVLFHPADSESAVAIDTRNNSPKDLHPKVSAIVFITPTSASPHREAPSAQTTPSHKILRTVTAEPMGKELKEARSTTRIKAMEAFGRGWSHSRGPVTPAWTLWQLYHVFRAMSMPAKWI